MTLTITVLALAVAIALCLCVETLSDLKEDRERKGAAVIKLRDESLAEGFVEDGTYEEKWEKAVGEYTAAQEKEELALKEHDKKNARHEMGQRIGRDAEKLASAHKSKLRPDYSPTLNRKANGSDAFPTANEWGTAIKLWASSKHADFFPTDEEMAIARKCRANPHAEEFILPSGPAVVAMIAEAQEIFASYPPARQAAAVREVWASWNTMTPESAGYIAEPPTVIRSLEINKLLFGGLLQVATVRQTVTGEDILLPFTDDTTVKGRRITEDGPLGVENNPRFGQMRWGAYKYTSDLILVTYEMTRDSFIGLEEHIGSVGGNRLGRIENDECTLGNGASMPRGIVFAAPVGRQTAANNAITTDDIIDLEASVDDAYIQGGTRVGFMLNKGILTYLRKLKDLQGRPFYILGQETGNRDELNGKSIYLNYSMANALATLADVMLYGDLAKYVIRRVGGTRLVRDPYTQKVARDAEIFAAVEYMDGNLVNAGTAPVKKLRMAV